ncbi:uncharacterized protein UPF0180 [Orenia metallireducens]|jgi:hypothetical protein|uniref:Uncharacterized protein family (UPF0180) n=1 Tax=Orenia metallireducens TaxID=1413210 RepID=A0A285H2C5_9FIRM|nr:YkuS family protein [Orenia metallireducens]PRX29458.1 uncharacterized protein UPF0180 [Orenia metallireducens]SNY29979.1 Uncharacterised protein family (UPF0180) [Orenia metallireducens]
MKGKIAVEGSLSNIRESLMKDGFEVADLNNNTMKNVDAIIVTGADNNMMNMSDIQSKAQIINAKGLSAEEVKNELKNRLV